MADIYDLLHSHDDDERKQAIVLLARQPSKSNLLIIQNVAESDESVEVRYFARKSIDAVKKDIVPKVSEDSPQTFDIGKLKKYLDGSRDEKLEAIQYAINNNLRDHIHLFLDKMFAEEDARVLSALITGVGKLGNESHISHLVPFLDDENSRVRANTIESLELIGSNKIYPYVIKKLDDPDNRVIANAAKALKNFGAVNTLKILRAMASSGQACFQASAAYAFQFFVSEDNVLILGDLLGNPDQTVRNNAMKSLKKYSENGIESAAVLLNNDESPSWILDFGLDDLEKEIMAASSMSEEACKAIDDPDPSKRIEAITKAMRTNSGKTGKVFLDRILIEPDPKVTATLLINLGRLQYKTATGAIAGFLTCPDNRCRANAVEALKIIGDKEALTQVAPLLRDANNRVKANAIIALSGEKDVDVSIPLAEMVDSKEELMQKSAFYTITELRLEKYYPHLLRLERSVFSEVSRQASEYIGELEAGGVEVRKKRAGRTK